ncbi:MAG: hypothetical protein EPN21_20275 [Methylococcaceae bacterium]|nr:MAG: hypothetical protein EPN21_20275 [Methylococcaceae bacterium]
MIKKILVNGALLLFSVLAVVLSVEWFIDHYLITQTPLKFQYALADAPRILAQSSKRGRLPENYLALVGDSYAQGKGDWLLEADPNQNGPFHSAHLIQQRTGQDVISFGKSGVGSVGGIAVEPIADYEFLKNYVDSAWQPPQKIWVYFYAGNDLTDNLESLHRTFLPHHAITDLHNQAIMDGYFREQIENRRGVRPFPPLPTNKGWLFRAVYTLLDSMSKKLQDPEVAPAQTAWKAGTTLARIAGRETLLPDGLQANGLYLSETQVQDAVAVLQASLAYLHRYFPAAEMTTIYVPSVLEPYDVVSEDISYAQYLPEVPTHKHSIRKGTTRLLQQRSNALCRQVRAAALVAGTGFIDTRARLRTAAQQELIHGPRDWKHFNKAGYHALVAAILDQPAMDCMNLSFKRAE